MTGFGTATIIEKLRLIITVQRQRVIKSTGEKNQTTKQKNPCNRWGQKKIEGK